MQKCRARRFAFYKPSERDENSFIHIERLLPGSIFAKEVEYLGALKMNRKTLKCLLLSLALTACNGGGDSQSSNNGSGKIELATREMSVALDPVLPLTSSSAITKIISPLGAAQPGGAVTIPISKEADTLVIAVDSKDRLILASMASSSSVVLSFDSTALALCRIALGHLPEGLSSHQANQTIRATSEFPGLVSLVASAGESGVSPLDSSAVADGIITVISQATATFSGLLTGLEETNRAVTTPRLVESDTAPFPFTLVPDTGGLYSVYIKGGRVDIVNSMQINWNAYSSISPGTLVELPSNSTLASIRGYQSPWNGPAPVVIPGNNGKGFNLTLFQTEQTRRRNIGVVIKGFALFLNEMLAIKTAAPDSCQRSFAEKLIQPDSFNHFGAQDGADSFKNYLASITLDPSSVYTAVSSCIVDSKAKTQAVSNLAEFARVVGDTVTKIAVVPKVYDAVGFASTTAQLLKYWNASNTVSVCESAIPDQPLAKSNVISCVASFEFEPKDPAMLMGTDFDPTIIAKDVKGQTTGLPANLAFLAITPRIVKVSPKAGRIETGGLLGSGSVIVQDQFTGASSEYLIDVVDGRIQPGTLNLAQGTVGSFQAVSPDGKPVISRRSGAVWFVNDASIANMSGARLMILERPGVVNIQAVSAGSTTIRLIEPQRNIRRPAQSIINVLPAP